jgi:hypothetical protein
MANLFRRINLCGLGLIWFTSFFVLPTGVSAQVSVDSLGSFMPLRLSADGTTVIGVVPGVAGVYWSEATGIVSISDANRPYPYVPWAVSSDGTLIAGYEYYGSPPAGNCHPDSDGWTSEARYFSWTLAPPGAPNQITPPDDNCYYAMTVSDDGRVAGAYSVLDTGTSLTRRPFSWKDDEPDPSRIYVEYIDRSVVAHARTAQP